jgi:transcriptional regulator with XRE-family HTH domain
MRKARGLTQSQLSVRSNVKRESISEYENGSPMRPDTLSSLLDGMGASKAEEHAARILSYSRAEVAA